MERVVTWAIQEGMKDIDGSVTMAALLGVGLDSASLVAAGFPPEGALVAGAAIGAGPKVVNKLRGGGKS